VETLIAIAAPVVEDEEIAAVNRVLKSKQLAQGPVVTDLESSFARLCGTDYATALNSGTAALHCALHAIGIGPGDEVITVPFTFIATVNSILMTGAKPVFVDIDPSTFNLDASKLESAITPRTKAIIPVHLFGQPCDMDEIKSIANHHNLKIVEDACQSVGATYKGRSTGSLGDLGCFSLYATKNIQCGEGGVVTMNDESYLASVKRFRQHGMTSQYQYVELGYNYRLSDLHAAIAVEQVKKLESFTKTRQLNAKILADGLIDIPGIVVPSTAPNRTHVYHQFTIRVTDESRIGREALIMGLKEKGIGSAVFYPKGLHLVDHVKKLGFKEGDFPVTEEATRQVVSLPVHPGVSESDANAVIRAIQELAHV
jgi:perosamine synthetase